MDVMDSRADLARRSSARRSDDARLPALVRRTLVTALFHRMADQRATADFVGSPLGDLVSGAADVTRRVFGALAPEVSLTPEVGVPAGGPGLVVLGASDGDRRLQVGIQVVGHADLLVRERVDELPARRAAFLAEGGPDTLWGALLAGDVGVPAVRQRVLAVHSALAGSGALVVAPQYSSAFLGLTAPGIDALVARVARAGDRTGGC